MKKGCLACGRIFHKSSSDSRRYWKAKKYCSLKCSGTLFKRGHIPWSKGKKGLIKIGKESPSYKGGRNTAPSGYIRILVPGMGRYRFEHRIRMEKFLGRKLRKGEIVHHINGNRRDNRISNLLLMKKNEHDRYETKRRWIERPSSFNQ